MNSGNDSLTIVYYTANKISDFFFQNTKHQLLLAAKGLPIISVSQKPIELGENICIGDIGSSHFNIYRQALIGAKAATTKYIALAEDDVLYSPDHFKHRSSPGKFAYNMSIWGIYTWNPTVYSSKERRNLNSLICERELFIEAIEERFKKYPDDSKIKEYLWAEPSKYERQLGVTVRESEIFYTNVANIMFSHTEALSYKTIGEKKRLGELRALEVPGWGHVNEVMKLYA